MELRVFKAMTDDQIESEAAELFGYRAALTVSAAKAYAHKDMDALAEIKVLCDKADNAIEMVDRELKRRFKKAVG